MLDGRDWDTITVEDVCLVADVSPSSFYRRFRSKDSLLEEMHRRWLANRTESAKRLVNELPWDDMSAHDICLLISRIYIADRAQNSPRALSMFRVQVSHPNLASVRMRNDRANLTLVADRLAQRVQADPAEVAFALLALSSVIHAAVQPPAPFVEFLGWTDDQLAHRCVDVFSKMLDVDM